MGTVITGKKITLPANQEKVETILTVPEGKKITIRAFGKTTSPDYIAILERDGNREIEMPADLAMGYGAFIPYNREVEGPADIKVGGLNLTSSDIEISVALAYEE